MNAELLMIVRCPRCRGMLDRSGDGDDAALRCRGCAAVYPVARGIPRFAGEAYVASSGPRRAFAQVAATVKPGGRLAVWLYRKNTRPQEAINAALRAVTTRLPTRVLEPICVGLGVLGGIPVLNRTLNKVANFSNHPD